MKRIRTDGQARKEDFEDDDDGMRNPPVRNSHLIKR